MQEVVHQPCEWVEAHDPRGVGHEVRERIDVVVIQLAVAGVDQVLDPADVDVRRPHDTFDLFHDFRQRPVTLHPPAPEPPMLGFTTTGKRRSRAATAAWDAWLITRARGYGRPRRWSSESWSAFDVSVT